MDANTILWIIVGIIILDFLFETTLELLNIKHSEKEIPEILNDIYDEEKYRKSILYNQITTRFGIFKSALMTILTIAMFIFGGFAYLHDLSARLATSEIGITMTFFGLLYAIMFIVELPFSYYATFVIEEKFGFNKTTHRTFILDKIKSLLLTIIIGGGILWLIVYLYFLFKENFWIYAWAIVTVFSLFMITFYSDIIVPLFNKQTPLEDGELKEKIMELAEKAGFKVSNIYKIDGSKRSTKANAYFTGLGSRKRIVLYDTLIETMDIDEILSVLAHEIGHYKHKHIIKSFIFNTLNTGIIFYLFSVVVDSKLLSEAILHPPFGYRSAQATTQAFFHLNIIVFSVLYSPVSTVTGIVFNHFSRKNEFEADAFAKTMGLARQLVTALKKLAKNNLSNLTPHPFYVKVHYSHPDLHSRIKQLIK